MAKEIIGASVEVEYKSIGEMRKAIKEATGDVIRMQQQFGNTSKEALEAAKRVAQLKDRVKEASEVTQLFDPGNKFKALGNTIQVAAGGFAALQGAMGLFGVKSEEVEKQLLKVQSALALSQGLSTVADGAKEFGRLASMIKGPVVAAFTTLRGALMATGIGLVTSAVAYLVTNFEKVKKVVYDTFPSLKGLFDNFDRIKQIAYGVGNAILQFIVSPVKALIKVIKGDFSGAMAELKQGASFTKNFREGEQNEIKSQQEEKDKIRAEEMAKLKAENDAKLAEQRRAAEQRRKEREAEAKRIAEEKKRAFEQEMQENERRVKSELDFMASEAQRKRDAEAKEKEAKDKQLQEDIERQNKGVQNQLSSFDIIRQKAEENLAIQTAIERQKQNLYYDTASTLGIVADLIGKQTVAGKALAIAQATINTWLGATEVLRQKSILPEPAATISKIVNVAAIVASGINSIKNIVKAPVPGGGGGSFSAPSLAAPIQPTLTPQAQSTALNSAAINNIGNKAIQAYILNSDLQSNAQINAILQRNASLG